MNRIIDSLALCVVYGIPISILIHIIYILIKIGSHPVFILLGTIVLFGWAVCRVITADLDKQDKAAQEKHRQARGI